MADGTQTEQRKGRKEKERLLSDERDFSNKGCLCVAINLGANHQSERWVASCRPEGGGQAGQRTEAELCLLYFFIWRAALTTTWKHRNSGRRAANRGARRHRQKILMPSCLYKAAAGGRKKHRRLLQVVAVQEVSRNEKNCVIKLGCPPTSNPCTHRPQEPVALLIECV